MTLTETDAALLESVQEGVDDALHTLTDPFGVTVTPQAGRPSLSVGARDDDASPYPVTVQGFFSSFTCAVPAEHLHQLIRDLTVHLTSPPLA